MIGSKITKTPDTKVLMIINTALQSINESDVYQILELFDKEDTIIGNPVRNQIKKVIYKNVGYNIKSFKKPHFINQVIYGYFRKSKAKRSFEYATILESKQIGTPKPIAYLEKKNVFGLQSSYYISDHLEADLTYRELLTNLDYPNHEAILRAFTRFTFDLHEKGVNFLDHSPGNTLITTANDNYEFYLVDLNRMEFKTMNFQDRMLNFSRLTPIKEMVEVMSDEYAKNANLEYDDVFEKMWGLTQIFQHKFHRKQRLKKQFKFWK